MNKFYKQMSLLLFFVIFGTILPSHDVNNEGLELEVFISSQNELISSQEQQVNCYKKYSLRIASALIIAAIITYLYALRNDKVISPLTLLSGMFFVTKKIKENNMNDNSSSNTLELTDKDVSNENNNNDDERDKKQNFKDEVIEIVNDWLDPNKKDNTYVSELGIDLGDKFGL
ncbi:MAG TPA: hypothetical protein VLB80_00980 [Candidatus Babeliales bacterium]|nr:hypothetical protein [Candidatus Babeliales bacterium]